MEELNDGDGPKLRFHTHNLVFIYDLTNLGRELHTPILLENFAKEIQITWFELVNLKQSFIDSEYMAMLL